LFAQKEEESHLDRPKKNIFLSTIGADLTIVSINYDRLFLIKPKFFLTIGMGMGFNTHLDDFELQRPYHLTFPQHFTMNFGKRKSFFEFGIGGTVIFGDELHNGGAVYYEIYPLIGFRLHPFKSKKMNFRVYSSFPPSFIISDAETLVFWWSPIGVSLGVIF
jgi:hypothetical protein